MVLYDMEDCRQRSHEVQRELRERRLADNDKQS
jgi:hypothetical protein